MNTSKLPITPQNAYSNIKFIDISCNAINVDKIHVREDLYIKNKISVVSNGNTNTKQIYQF